MFLSSLVFKTKKLNNLAEKKLEIDSICKLVEKGLFKRRLTSSVLYTRLSGFACHVS